MILLTARNLPSASMSVREALGHKQDELYSFVNKYDGDIPIILNNDGEVIREAHSFLYEKHLFTRSISSKKTVQTYGECLVHWLKYCSSEGLDWKKTNTRSILSYRNSMKAAARVVVESLRPATINLRVTVVVEFLKYFHSNLLARKSNDYDSEILLSKLANTKFTIRSTHSRPVALSAENCREISAKLCSAHRVIFIWAISTGLRISSMLSATLKNFNSIPRRGGGGFIEVPAKGGKWIKVYLTRHVIDETDKYIRIERKLLELRADKKKNIHTNSLFLNMNGGAINRSCYYAAYQRACKSLNIKSYPHQTRTTFASFMERTLRVYAKENNIDHIKIIQGLLGHTSSNTTMVYLESLEINNVEILNLLEQNSEALGGENAKIH